jgi:hypothetical protein
MSVMSYLLPPDDPDDALDPVEDPLELLSLLPHAASPKAPTVADNPIATHLFPIMMCLLLLLLMPMCRVAP